MAIGMATAGWVSWASATNTIAARRLPRRHEPIPANRNVNAHRNGIIPTIGASTSAGFTNAAAAHHPRPNSGNAHNIVSNAPADPTIRHNVTLHSPSNGHNNAATIHGSDA